MDLLSATICRDIITIKNACTKPAMWRTWFTFLVFLCYIFEVRCRKYDLQSEAIKLYGEDLKNLLMRFRRSPEYMNILDDKVQELKEDFDDMMIQITYAYKTKIENKIKEDLIEKEKSKDGNRMVHRRQDDDTSTDPSTTISTVEKLDQYTSLMSSQTVAEKNHYKDLGFKFAGEAIHAMIKQAMSSVGEAQDTHAEQKSTRMTDERKPVVTTTEHVKVHEVTTEGHTEAEATTTPTMLRYKYRASNDTTPKKHRNMKEPISKTTERVSVDKARRQGEFGLNQKEVQKTEANQLMREYPEPDIYANSVANATRRLEMYGNKKYKPGAY